MIENIRKNAELVRRVALEKFETSLEYDRFGVEWLDNYITRQHEIGGHENPDGLVGTLGSFFGECILQSYGGQWAQSEYGWCIQFDEKNGVFPFSKVEKHLTNGPEDSVLSLFDSIAAIRD